MKGQKNNPERIVKKSEAKKRIDRLDPNNNINNPESPIVKRRGKKMRDDGFEHRTSRETASLPLHKV